MYESRKSNCSERIATALSLKKMKQAELCEKTKIPKSAMSQYISGAFEPKQDRIYLIAKALNVSEAWLMGYDVPMERRIVKQPTETDGLSEKKKALIDFAMSVPEDKAEMILRVMKSIVEAD